MSDYCPLCNTNKTRLLYDSNVILAVCRKCGVIFNQAHKALNYNDDYFTAQYQKQYGKTYVEDFDNIYKASTGRLKKIFRYINKKKEISKLRLLDIGSAAGFFLKAAQDYGIYELLGIEISGYAAKYCAEKFGINVLNASFSDISLPENLDLISAWYFIEHCSNPADAVAKIYNALNPGGVFAFSTPSFFGPQYAFNRDEWFKTHPVDHRIDFSPSSVRNFLKKAGFGKIYTFPGGIHPERVIRKESIFFHPFKAIYTVLSGIFSFSDTMEVYAIKNT
jgi:SAM-dependent methyltransferase